jgi:peptidoglycan/LPS O-acetylase OafA/YrhL
MRRIKELDGLRAIAIIAVLATHFVHESTWVASFLRLGWAGVDLFFALSGFLITNILLDLRGKKTPFRTFYWRRGLRILPPYYLALVITLALAAWHGEHPNSRAVFHHALFLSSAKPGLVKSALLRFFPHTPDVAVSQPVQVRYLLPYFKDGFAVYWSLSVEELFYLVWAPIVLKGSRRLVIFCATVPLLICPLLRGLAHMTPHMEESTGFVFRFDSLTTGACIALLFWAIDRGRIKSVIVDRAMITGFMLSLLGLLVVAIRGGATSGVDVRTTKVFAVLGFTLLTVMCSSLVGICARWSHKLGFCSVALTSQPLTYIGQISYTVYLFHLQIYVLFGLVFIKLLGRDPVAAGRIWGLSCGLLATAGVMALAGLSWRYIEAPILRLKDVLFPMRVVDPDEMVREPDTVDRVCA